MDDNITLIQDPNTVMQERTISGDGDRNRYAMLPGTVLDRRYRIERVIGQGGFGITYEAVNVHNGTRVAVKEYFCRDFCRREVTSEGTNGAGVCITDETLSGEFRSDLERFLREARTLHDFASEEAIVRIMDYFEANDTAYIVMEYLDGTTLRDHIRSDGIWGMEKTVRCFVPVMEAMEHVHRAGVIHRDISPDNLMVMPDGTLRLLDFGAARKSDNMQTTHSVIYKAYYSAPEQRDPKGVLGTWTDVYGLCSTMYYCLTGHEPEDVLTRLLFDDIEKPSAKGADILPAAERILMKGLALDREARVQDMGALRTELEKVYPPITEEEKKRDRERRQRRRRIAAAVAAFLLACLALCAYAFRTRIRFHFIETQETAFDGSHMTPEEFADSSAKVKKRVAVLGGKQGYLWKETDGQQIRFTVAADVYEGQDPQDYAWYVLSRPMTARIHVRDVQEVNESGETVMKYRDLGILDQEEDVRDLEESEEGLQLYLSEKGQEKFGSVLKVPGLETTITWDEYDIADGERSVRCSYESALMTGDGESILIPHNPSEDVSVDFNLMRHLFTNSPLTACFQAQSAWSTRWEDPGSTLLPGKYQCKEKEIPGPTVSLHYNPGVLADIEDETGYAASLLSFQAVLKNRLDGIGKPYAVGVNSRDRYEYVVRLPLEEVYMEELEELGQGQWVHLGSDREYEYSFLTGSRIEIRRKEEADSFEIAIVAEGDYAKRNMLSMMQKMEEQGKKEVYLYLDEKAVAAGDLKSALQSAEDSGEILLTRWLFSGHPEMTSDTEHFAGYLIACKRENPQDGFFLQDTEICGTDGKVMYFSKEQPETVWKGRAQQVVEKWEKEKDGLENGALKITEDSNSLEINVYGCEVEDPASTMQPFIDYYEKEDLGLPGIKYIRVYFYDGKKGSKSTVYLRITLAADFARDAMLIRSSGSISCDDEVAERYKKLPDLYNSYMDQTPFWKEKISDKLEGPVFEDR